MIRRSRVRGQQPQAMLAHLHALLFEEEGFSGNVDDYYNTANNLIPIVLKTRRGLPITLSLVYKNVAGRLGIPVSWTPLTPADRPDRCSAWYGFVVLNKSGSSTVGSPTRLYWDTSAPTGSIVINGDAVMTNTVGSATNR